MSKRKGLPIPQDCKHNGIILWDTETLCDKCIIKCRRLLDEYEIKFKDSANQFNDKYCIDCKEGPLDKSCIIMNTCNHCCIRYTYRCNNCTTAVFTVRAQSLCNMCKCKDSSERSICYLCCYTCKEDEFVVCEDCNYMTYLCTDCKTRKKITEWPCEHCAEENDKQIEASGTNWKNDDYDDKPVVPHDTAAAVDTTV